MAEFTRSPEEGVTAFHELFGLEYNGIHRVIFLYYLILVLALFVNFVSMRCAGCPIGRAWEALREDDIACQSLGINRRNIKLAAFMFSATFGGVAGSFFATRQGFISPESFTVHGIGDHPVDRRAGWHGQPGRHRAGGDPDDRHA
jgi:branched-chain amino acid transport system permease protein